jgi:hypothetical protein
VKAINAMTEAELRTALIWCMRQLRTQWKGRTWSDTWGQEGSPWHSEAKPLSKPQAKIGEAT